MAPPETRETSGAWVWWVAGCGGLLLMFLCIVPVAAYFVWSPDDAPDGPISPAPPITPTPPVVPTPPIAPTPPTPGPLPMPGPLLPPSGSTSPRHVTAVVEETHGLSNVATRDPCTIEVTREDRPDGTFWCNAQITCGGQLIYGGGGSGYFECTLYDQPERHVVGEDRDTSPTDRDPAMRIDTLRGTLTIRDEGGTNGTFSLRAHVTGVS